MWNTFQDKKFAIALRLQHGNNIQAFRDVLSVTHKLSHDEASILYDDITFIKNEGISLDMLFASL